MKDRIHSILNYLHVRTTVSLSNLAAGVHGICSVGRDYKEYIEPDKAQLTIFYNGSENVDLRSYGSVHLPNTVRAGLNMGPLHPSRSPDVPVTSTNVSWKHVINATMSFAVNLFNQNENATSSRGLRQMRDVIIGGISLLLGGYNFEQTRELSSLVGQIEQAWKNAIFAVRHLSTASTSISSNLGRLKQVMLRVFGEFYFLLPESRLTNIGQHLMHVSHQRIHQIEKSIEKLYDALGGRLSPKLIDPATLETVIRNFEVRSSQQKFDLITNSVGHIFEMSTSLFAEDEVVDVSSRPSRTQLNLACSP